MLSFTAFQFEGAAVQEEAVNPELQKDIKVAKLFNEYYKALASPTTHSFIDIIHQLSPFIADHELTFVGADIQSSPSIQLLHYLCRKNLGHLLVQGNRLEEAIHEYTQALVIDSCDAALWKKLGDLTYKLGNYLVSKELYFGAIYQVESFSSIKHTLVNIFYEGGPKFEYRKDAFWPTVYASLKGLYMSLYQLGYYTHCLEYIKLTAQLCKQQRVHDHQGLVLKYQIIKAFKDRFTNSSYLEKEITNEDLIDYNRNASSVLAKYGDEFDFERHIEKLAFQHLSFEHIPITLERLDWKTFGNLLINSTAELLNGNNKTTTHRSKKSKKSATTTLPILKISIDDYNTDLLVNKNPTNFSTCQLEFTLSLPEEEEEDLMIIDSTPITNPLSEELDPPTQRPRTASQVSSSQAEQEKKEIIRQSKRVREMIESTTPIVSAPQIIMHSFDDVELISAIDGFIKPVFGVGVKEFLDGECGLVSCAKFIDDDEAYFVKFWKLICAKGIKIKGMKRKGNRAFNNGDNEIVIPEESTSTLIKNYVDNSVAADENDFPQFFDSVKTENSGIFDLLQKFVLKSVVVVDGCVQINKSFWKSLDGDELILWKVIRILECNFCRIERLGVDEVFHGVGPFEFMLLISEYLYSISTPKQLKTNFLHDDSMWNVYLKWYTILSQKLTQPYLSENRRFALRFAWLNAKTKLSSSDYEGCLSRLTECKELLQELDGQNYEKSIFESTITLERITSAIQTLSAKLIVLSIPALFNSGEYTRVYDRLSALFFTRDDDPSRKFFYDECDLVHRCRLYKLFGKCCDELGKGDEKFVGLIVELMDLIRSLDDFDYFVGKILDCVGMIMPYMNSNNLGYLITLLQSRPSMLLGTLETTLFDQFIYSGFVFIRILLSVYNFIDKRIAGGLNIGGILEDVITLCTTGSIFLIHFLELVSVFNVGVNGNSEDGYKHKIDLVAEGFAFVHHQLGMKKLCSFDGGKLIKMEREYLIQLNDPYYKKRIYQSYFCLYGIHVKVDNDVFIDDHESETLPFDSNAAKDVFDSIADFFEYKEKSRVPPDVKSCLEKIVSMFPDPPFENPKVAFNKTCIMKFLESDIDLEDTNPRRGPKLALFEFLEGEKREFSDIFFRLYYIQGKIAYSQHKSRSVMVKTKKGSDFLPITIENYLCDLYLNPTSFDTWLSLAICYSELAYELLCWSSDEIALSFTVIRQYQIKAFHCFTQAYHYYRKFLLDKPLPKTKSGLRYGHTKPEIAQLLYANFGYLIHSIATQPMKFTALTPSKINLLRALKESNTDVDAIVDVGKLPAIEIGSEGDKTKLLRIGSWCFRMAFKGFAENWEYPHMIGRFYEKLKCDYKEIIKLYQKSILLVPAEYHVKEQEKIFDPHYKLISFVCKLLMNSTITSDEAVSILDKSIQDCWGLEICKQQPPENQESASENAGYDMIVRLLRGITVMDKKRWQHRVIYKLAYIQYLIHKDPIQAKDTLSPLINLKASVLISNFWKPEFEFPGKHFLYIKKYILFFIQLCVETEDLESFQVLSKKLGKTDVLNLDKVWKICYDSFFKTLVKFSNLTGPVPKLSLQLHNFQARAQQIEPKIFTSLIPLHSKSIKIQAMIRGLALKKYNESWENTDELDSFLVDLFSDLLMELSEDVEGEDDGNVSLAMKRNVGKGDILKKINGWVKNTPVHPPKAPKVASVVTNVIEKKPEDPVVDDINENASGDAMLVGSDDVDKLEQNGTTVQSTREDDSGKGGEEKSNVDMMEIC